MPNFVTVGQTDAERASFQFSKWRPSAILDSLCIRLSYPRRAFDRLNCCAKCGWNRLWSFEDMRVAV